MAHRHGLAGQYCRTEAVNRSKGIIVRIVVIGACGFLAYGFVWGYFWSQTGPLLALLPILAVTALLWLTWRRIEPHMEKVATERLNYLRGGRGEELIDWLLDALDDEWHIFNGVKLQPEWDVDHILVGPNGVFCISTKSNRGLFARDGDGLLYNGKPSNFGEQVRRQAMDLKEHLKRRMGGDAPEWVEAMLAVPFGWTEGYSFGKRFWLVHQDNIVNQIARENGRQKLRKQQIERVVKVMEMIKEE